MDDGVHFVIVLGARGGVADGGLVDGVAEDGGGVEESGGGGLFVAAFYEGDGVGYLDGRGGGVGIVGGV